MAEPNEPSSGHAQSQSDSEQEPAEYNGYNGGDITRPQNQMDVRLQYRNSWQPDTRTQQGRMLLRITSKIKLDAGWRAGLLAEVPFVDKKTMTFDSSDSGNSSSSENKFGIGDAAFQAYLADDLDQNWAFGFGARGVGPSAQDSLGSGKWQIMPGLGLRYSFTDLGPDTYFVPVIRYALSVAGDPTRRNIRQAQISPKLNIGLSERWFITLYPSYDVRINDGPAVPGQTGRLFLPFDVAVGREISKGVLLSLEVSVPIIRDFPVYNFKTELRMVARF
jgi:Putative MetA-pathway of phenol degradation